MIRITDILDQAATYLDSPDIALIQKAYVFSAAAHAGQVRLSGEPYLSHPLEVSNILVDLRLDADTIVAGLLHDTVEDTAVTVAQITADFGPNVGAIIEGVTKISKMNFQSKEQAQAENIRKMIIAMANDIRVLLVKLADRLHNISTLEFQKEHKRRAIAQETLAIYAPLANRMGLYRIKVQLENESLKYLKPDIYAQISEQISRFQEQGQAYIKQVCDIIQETMEKNGIQGRISGRIKHIYSIYNKMKRQDLLMDQIYDMLAFRVIVSTVTNCYEVMGLMHGLWTHVPGKFKDYITMPKPNKYQSLHTTVIGPGGEYIEIQIRTEEMHRLAQDGVAAHWSYKERGSTKVQETDHFDWLRQIMEWQGDLKDSREFMTSLSQDLSQEEIFVFTPLGDVKKLPEGSTPVDFAYTIHTQVGDRCAGAKVDGRLVPLNTPLKTGQKVEIITDASRHPSQDWLQFVKSGKAISRIKHWFSTTQREHSLATGRELLEKEGRRMGVNVPKGMKDGSFETLAGEFSFHQMDDLISAVGHGRITPKQVLHKLLPKAEAEESKPPERTPETPRPKNPETAITIVGGVDDMLIRIARCCNPLPGDPIIGYISRGLGVTVHTEDCPNVANMEVDRLMDVNWTGAESKVLPVRIKVICQNQCGVLSMISAQLNQEGVNIESGKITSRVDGLSELDFVIEVNTAAHLYDVIAKLRKIDAVRDVIRIAEG